MRGRYFCPRRGSVLNKRQSVENNAAGNASKPAETYNDFQRDSRMKELLLLLGQRGFYVSGGVHESQFVNSIKSGSVNRMTRLT
jgi:hypothetical protein